MLPSNNYNKILFQYASDLPVKCVAVVGYNPVLGGSGIAGLNQDHSLSPLHCQPRGAREDDLDHFCCHLCHNQDGNVVARIHPRKEPEATCHCL